ncbi:efflux RND transporter permease subunit [Salinarimonas soli]|uniref:Efflux RND transporter permease subunit n=1 Tax=Salinarimonas soli TaxID=1638099 RepID=A0A5B2V9U7_9HYPH|nr:efflux RND transporter permease subunit [Salinarimonas soli]KAA2235162.1 efflux RND transporter permease subunit [Salinarimonas soli]
MRLADLPTVRPVLAVSANLILIAVGIGAAFFLPIREYPNIDPPTVSVTTRYPGAPAEVIEREVTNRIEDNLSGIPGIRTIEARSRNETSSISLQFKAGTNIDAVAADVRDKVSGVRSELPETVEEPVIEKADADDQPMMYITLRSDRIAPPELTDIAQRRLVDALGSVSGVSRVTIGGEKRYAMRIWLDRQAMAARGITPNDVADRLRAENVELPAGLVETSTQEIVVRAETRFRTAAEFAALAIRGEGENRIRVGDVARVEVGVENEKGGFRSDGNDAIALGIVRQSDANTLEVAAGVKAELERLRPTLPASIDASIGYDESIFIRETLTNVVTTLAQSIGIVLVVIFLFLGSLRGTLIPAATIPAAIIPAAIIAAALGFSINVLTILAVILAIGLCTDDAVVIMENIRRRQARGEALLVASARSTRELGTAVFASSLVLVAVILPLAFLQGNVGLLFREFAVVLVSIVVISGFSAITLGPMLSTLLLRGGGEPNRLVRWINAGLDRLTAAYGRVLKALVRRSWIPLLAGAAFAAAGVAAYFAIPAELAPDEDRGSISVVVEGPEGASAAYMNEQVAGIERALADLRGEGEDKPVEGLLSIVVPSFGGGQAPSNTARVIVRLKEWADRTMKQDEVRTQVQRRLAGITGVRAFAVNPPKLGQRGGGRGLQVAISGLDRADAIRWANDVLGEVRKIDGLVNPDIDYKDTRPQISVGIDRERAAAIGVDARTLGTALQIMFGSLQVTRYVERGEEYNVILQAQRDDRSSPRDIDNVFVRASGGSGLVPLSSVVRLTETSTVRELRRVDRLPAVRVEANLTPAITLGQAVEKVETIAEQRLPAAAQVKYLGESRDYQETGNAVLYALAFVLVLVFLLMAAQFESFLYPLIILTSAPVALAGGLVTIWALGFTLNIYSQIGMILLIGLVAKNAILLVEFANQRREEGLEPADAAVDAAKQRLRPILMTSLATVLGAVPLILESGAGAEARVTVGVVTTGGVTLGTLLTLFVVPAAYTLAGRHARKPGALEEELADLEREADAKPQPAE